jgi:hypothetical protein
MRQLTYSSAVGTCVLGAGIVPVRAAEWSIIPVYSAAVDYDTNRRLQVEPKGSESSVVTADLSFKRAEEDWDITLEPRYSLRRFSDPSLGNGDDRSMYAALNWTPERSTLNLTASYWDQSTLLTELLETGITLANTHRRQAQAGGNWTWSQTELWQLVSQVTYQDVSYYGEGRQLLPGFRYSSASSGERYAFSERGSFTVSAYGSILNSPVQGSSSHEAGLEGEIIYAFGERTRLDATLGESQRVLTGSSSHGTDASVSLTHDMATGNLALGYTRSLVPYGNGFLVERQQVTASGTRGLNPFVDLNFSLQHVQNNHTTVELELDRRSYDIATLGLTWRPAEVWSCSVQAQGLRTQTIGQPDDPVKEWRASVSVTWAPYPWKLSR